MLLTDAELEAIKLLDCPSCDSHNTSVRRASNEWWLVGCLDCFNKRQCQREYVIEEAEKVMWKAHALHDICEQIGFKSIAARLEEAFERLERESNDT